MEEVIMSYSSLFPITTARFANVAFSNGSLLAGYLERLMKNQPFSSPSDIRRFFVSPQESGQICLMACILGGSGDIFFPKLEDEQMMNFKDITISFLKTLGYETMICGSEEEARFEATRLKPGSKHYPVYFFVSETSGEKTFEEFYTDGEVLDLNTFHALGVIKNAVKKPLSEIQLMIGGIKGCSCETITHKSRYCKSHERIPAYFPPHRNREESGSEDVKLAMERKKARERGSEKRRGGERRKGSEKRRGSEEEGEGAREGEGAK